MIRVLHVGLGPIGAAVARQIAGRKGFRIVGAIDIDSKKIGQDVGVIIGATRKLRVKVGVDIGKTIKASKPDVAVLCTSSSLKGVLPELLEVIKHRVPVVTTTEEAAYPRKANRDVAKRIDEAARKARVAVLGTGVNPGFTMDALPIALSAVCERVDRIEVWRVQDARIRRLPFQLKIGTGLTPEEFQRKVESGSVRHVGFTESIQMIGDAIGWKLDKITDEVSPEDCRPGGLERMAVGCRRSGVRHPSGRCWVHQGRAEGDAASRSLPRCARVVRLGADRGIAADLIEDRWRCAWRHRDGVDHRKLDPGSHRGDARAANDEGHAASVVRRRFAMEPGTWNTEQ